MDQPNNQSQLNINNQPEQVPQTPPKGSQKQKVPQWAIFFIVVLSLIVIGGTSYGAYRYFYSQPVKPDESPDSQNQEQNQGTDDQFADWQTYQNEKYGYEIKYPPGFHISEQSEDEFVIFLSGQTKPAFLAGGHIVDVNTSINVNVGFYNLEESLRQIYERVSSSQILSDVDVDGHPGLKIKYTVNGVETLEIAVVKGYHRFVIADYYLPVDENTFDQIIKTFRFIEPANLRILRQDYNYLTVFYMKRGYSRQFDSQSVFYSEAVPTWDCPEGESGIKLIIGLGEVNILCKNEYKKVGDFLIKISDIVVTGEKNPDIILELYQLKNKL